MDAFAAPIGATSARRPFLYNPQKRGADFMILEKNVNIFGDPAGNGWHERFVGPG